MKVLKVFLLKLTACRFHNLQPKRHLCSGRVSDLRQLSSPNWTTPEISWFKVILPPITATAAKGSGDATEVRLAPINRNQRLGQAAQQPT